MVDGRAAPAPRAPAAGGSTGLCCPCVPRAPPHPTRSRRQRAEFPPHPPLSASPAPQTAGPAHPRPPGCRQEQARLFQAGEVGPSRANLLRSVSPPCRLPPRSDAHRRPHALRHDTAFVLLIWLSERNFMEPYLAFARTSKFNLHLKGLEKLNAFSGPVNLQCSFKCSSQFSSMLLMVKETHFKGRKKGRRNVSFKHCWKEWLNVLKIMEMSEFAEPMI
ncbi:uncharacterized protein [Agelaius tricolor]|uniref:uncharacterized protein n=1 Tax=Agelaius tricolor TaxID=9191 RepID=UPI0039F23D58